MISSFSVCARTDGWDHRIGRSDGPGESRQGLRGTWDAQEELIPATSTAVMDGCAGQGILVVAYKVDSQRAHLSRRWRIRHRETHAAQIRGSYSFLILV
jgi:hypothetical protein